MASLEGLFQSHSFAEHYECMKCIRVIGEGEDGHKGSHFLYPYSIGPSLANWVVITSAVARLDGKEES